MGIDKSSKFNFFKRTGDNGKVYFSFLLLPFFLSVHGQDTKMYRSPPLESAFKFKKEVILPITTNSYDFTAALRNHFQIVGNIVYWSIKTDDTSFYKVFTYNIKSAKFDSILFSHTNDTLKPPLSKDFAFSIYGNRVSYLFNTNKNETWLYLYKKKRQGIYEIYKTKKLNSIYNFLKLTSDKIVLAACYRYHPLQRKNNTEILILDKNGMKKNNEFPIIQYIESSLFLPFNMVDVANDIVVWGNPDKYKFTLYNASDLRKQKEYFHSYSNWETIDTSIIKQIRKNKYLHPRKVIDTLLKCCSHSSKISDIGFINDNTLLINYSIFDHQMNKRKYFMDIWGYRKSGRSVYQSRLEEYAIDTNLVFDNNSFPLLINNENYILGSNYLIIVKVDSQLSLIGNSYSKYMRLTEEDMLENDPVIKMIIYEYNDWRTSDY